MFNISDRVQFHPEWWDGQQVTVMGVAGEKLARKVAELIVEASKAQEDE